MASNTIFADFAITQAGISRTNQFVVMERPHYFYAARMGNFSNHGRKLGMDIVQVQDIGFKAIQQSRKPLYRFTITERTLKGLKKGDRFLGRKCDFGRPEILPRAIQILGIVHGEKGNFVTCCLKQIFQFYGIDTIATTTIVKLVCKQYTHCSTTSLRFSGHPVADPDPH